MPASFVGLRSPMSDALRLDATRSAVGLRLQRQPRHNACDAAVRVDVVADQAPRIVVREGDGTSFLAGAGPHWIPAIETEHRNDALARMREASAQCTVIDPGYSLARLERPARDRTIIDVKRDTGGLERRLQ